MTKRKGNFFPPGIATVTPQGRVNGPRSSSGNENENLNEKENGDETASDSA